MYGGVQFERFKSQQGLKMNYCCHDSVYFLDLINVAVEQCRSQTPKTHTDVIEMYCLINEK